MCDTHLRSPVTQQRLRSGPAAQHIDAFADWLDQQGYRPISIDTICRSLAGWGDWMRAAGLSVLESPAGLDACKTELVTRRRARYHRGPNQQSIAAARLFIRFLRQHDILPNLPSKAASATDISPLLREFHSWMHHHRGITDASLAVYEWILLRLLETLGHDPDSYTAERLREFVLERSRCHGIARAKSIVVAIRAFLRFLGATGRCPAGMEYAIPSFASWQLSPVPRFLAAEDVERLIASCSENADGLRDKAVLLLLARLGLRASEVAQLKFADIDWPGGQLTVSGKTRRQDRLPLSHEVGVALLRYLRQSRPPLPVPEVFTSIRAPLKPLTRASVTHIVRAALRRVSIKAPINGAHVLRHSCASAMLQQGASLASIGAVLRHRSPRMTAHYAKVDFDLLSEIAQPWPGVPSC